MLIHALLPDPIFRLGAIGRWVCWNFERSDRQCLDCDTYVTAILVGTANVSGDFLGGSRKDIRLLRIRTIVDMTLEVITFTVKLGACHGTVEGALREAVALFLGVTTLLVLVRCTVAGFHFTRGVCHDNTGS